MGPMLTRNYTSLILTTDLLILIYMAHDIQNSILQVNLNMRNVPHELRAFIATDISTDLHIPTTTPMISIAPLPSRNCGAFTQIVHHFHGNLAQPPRISTMTPTSALRNQTPAAGFAPGSSDLNPNWRWSAHVAFNNTDPTSTD